MRQEGEHVHSIGEVAKMIGSTVKTVRYYDEIGLLKPSEYTEGGHRLYTLEDIWRLKLITTLRYLDFAVEDIRQMISGEIHIAQALDWQIEALETQVATYTNMISILRQAKEHEVDGRTGDSLRFMNDLVDSLTINAQRRSQFILDKMEEPGFLDKVPPEWRDTFLYFFNKYILNEVKISAKQTVAWNELQELINDPQYLADLERSELPFFNMVHQPRVHAATWVKNMENIRIRVEAALEQQLAVNSSVVQAIVEDYVMLYANTEQVKDKTSFFRHYATHALDAVPEPIQRFNKLCLILNPKWSLIVEGIALLLQGMKWKLEHMDEG
ncbi:MerR family transcriptional regulator [Paenibacillus polymyxa]|uniref:MerR family transcriptional regulator n=1 Tax=Paenibacillus polymyxa TaxID=1406 RepID=UPI0008FC53F4|nr:MerR family transcriptional regulator [Paenibacillus polymyxa]APB71532.1 MerR family transcriptional regulator [Paenibacillus polymyxa]